MTTPERPAQTPPFAPDAPPVTGTRPADPRAVAMLGFGCAAVAFLTAVPIALVIVLGFILPAWRADHRYISTTCTVLGGRLDTPSSPIEPPPGRAGHKTYRPSVHVRFQANGRDVEAWCYDQFNVYTRDKRAQQAVVDGFKIGSTYPCWYDPDDPSQVVVVRSSSLIAWICLIIPAAIFGIAVLAFVSAWMTWKNPPATTPA